MIRNYKIVASTILFFFFSSSCNEIDSLLADAGLTNDEVIVGLKSALSVGTDTSVSTLSAEDGYFADELVKILLPAEALAITNNISKVPGGDLLLNQTILAINRAAEDAAIEAKPIFISAVKNMSIADGFEILNGESDAATQYLRVNTSTELTTAFEPKIGEALGKKLVQDVSAESAYSSLIGAYNKASLNGILFAKVETNSLTEHTTEKALDGLFVKIADEENKIRTDPAHRVTDILKRVFGNN